MKFMWVYSLAVIGLWAINPELRRLYEFREGYSDIDPVSVLPLLAVLPHVISLIVGGRWQRIPLPLMLAAWCWLGAFLYGLAGSAVTLNATSGAYTFANFVVPMAVGLWISTTGLPSALKRLRLERALFPITTVVAIYGIIQYALAPAWDCYWLVNSGLDSAGAPYPFQIRVFSTLNAPAPFGAFMTFALLLALPRFTIRRPLLLAQSAIWCVAFALSFVRSGWLAFAIGAILYFVLCARRTAVLSGFLGLAALACMAILAIPTITGDDLALTRLAQRVDTLGDLSNDKSANDRQRVYMDGIQEFLGAPLGEGLGVVGTSTKLTSSRASTTNFDSGYLARLIELGIPGGILFYMALSIILWYGWRQRRYAIDHGDVDGRNNASLTVACSVALLGWQASNDVYSGIGSLLLWCLAGTSVGVEEEREPQLVADLPDVAAA
jgi:hypothetical protein